MTDILKIENLRKVYNNTSLFGGSQSAEVLKGVSLTVKEGESFGLLGPSGCGKTTLAKIILGLETMTSGRVIIDGQDISTLHRLELRRLRGKVQVVFQDPYSSLNPRMSVRQILEEPFLIHDVKYTEAKLKKLLSLVGLASKFLDRYPHEFSGGQRQRIGIARALALDPKLLIADEPVSALDVSIQAQILNLLIDVKKEYNLSLIFISHDLALCNFLCDSAAVLYNGVVVEQGPAADLFKNPKSGETKLLLSGVLPLARADILNGRKEIL